MANYFVIPFILFNYEKHGKREKFFINELNEGNENGFRN